MARLRLAGLSSPRSGAVLSLASAGTTATWSSDPGFPTIASPDYLVCTAAPGTAQEEIFYVTAHTAAATTSTVFRNAEPTQSGQNSTAAQSTVGWVHAPTPLDFSALSAVPAYNMVPANLPNWRKAVANARTGLAASKVLMIGTSGTQGGGVGSNCGTQSIAPYLATALSNRNTPAQNTLGIIQPYIGTYDSRFAVGSGWTLENLGAGLGWADVGYVGGAVGAAGSLTFTPPSTQQVDTFDIWYEGNTGTGTLQAKVDSGTDTGINTFNATSGVYKQTVTCTRGTGHVLTLHTITTANVYVIAVDAYDSTIKSVHVGNAGVDSVGTAVAWAVATGGASIPCIEAYAPNLTLIELGADDAILGTPTTPAAFLTAVTAIVTACQLSGDVILWSFPLADPVVVGAPVVAVEQGYQAQLLSYAASNGIGYVNLSDRFGPYSTWNGNGFGAGDGAHPNALGNAELAGALASALLSVV